MEAAVHLLNYAATHPDATVRFRASDMILHIHSDASYLSKPKARSALEAFTTWMARTIQTQEQCHTSTEPHMSNQEYSAT